MGWLSDKCREYIYDRISWFKYFGWRAIILALLLLFVFAYINYVYGVNVDLLIGAWFLVMIVYSITSFVFYSIEDGEIRSRVEGLCSDLVSYVEQKYILDELLHMKREEILDVYYRIKELEEHRRRIEDMRDENMITEEEAGRILRKIDKRIKKYRNQLVYMVRESVAEYIADKLLNKQ